MSIRQRVRDYSRANGLIPEGQTLLVAVSGGPDSVCLLHLLTGIKEEMGIGLHVAHLNHQLRGEGSERDARYVADLAQRLGSPASIERRDVDAYRREHRLSPEEAAREVRYTFLAEVARSVGTNWVAVGHTTDDHIETVLMHIVRGTGTKGLRGLLPGSSRQLSGYRLNVIRPLLMLTRQETGEYCRDNGLEPCLDASNLSLSPLRNRIRHQLLPLLRDYNPAVSDALQRLASLATDDLAYIDGEVEKLWGRIVKREAGMVVLEREAFLGLPPALQRHLLRAAIEDLQSDLKDIETRHIEAIMGVLHKPAGKRVVLPAGLVFAIEYRRFVLGSDPVVLSPLPPLDGEFRLKVPGETILPGWMVEASLVDKLPHERKTEYEACLDFDKAGDELTVRPRRPSDRFQPLGMSQYKKVGQFMIDAKIPQGWRQRVPLVCSPRQILWLVGWRPDERVKVTPSTRRILCLRFQRR